MYKKLCIILASILLTACSSLLFYPMSYMVRSPADLGLNYQDIRIQSQDGTLLHAWWLKAQGEVRGTVIFLHGNAENISTHIGSVYWLPEQGYQVLLLDYRGYGQSEGLPLLPDVFDDIRAAIEWVFARVNNDRQPVFLLAQSLGASMGGYVVGADKAIVSRLDGVVLDAGFASYAKTAKDVATRHWLTWMFQYPASWGMPTEYDLEDYIAQISPTPLLIIHSEKDAVIPFKNAELLYREAKAPKYLLTYKGAHIETFNYPENRQALLDFFEKNQ